MTEFNNILTHDEDQKQYVLQTVARFRKLFPNKTKAELESMSCEVFKIYVIVMIVIKMIFLKKSHYPTEITTLHSTDDQGSELKVKGAGKAPAAPAAPRAATHQLGGWSARTESKPLRPNGLT